MREYRCPHIPAVPTDPRDALLWHREYKAKYDVSWFYKAIASTMVEVGKGGYSHNIITCWLQTCARLHGTEVTNKLLTDLGIDRIYGIPVAT